MKVRLKPVEAVVAQWDGTLEGGRKVGLELGERATVYRDGMVVGGVRVQSGFWVVKFAAAL